VTDPTFVLLHSPLIGPASWQPVADAMTLHGFRVTAPRIDDADPPHWRSYADRAAEAITDLALDDDDEVTLVLHSGAGSIAAVIADISIARIAAIIFVDATLPHDGWSRLDEMEAHDAEFARGIRADLEAGVRYPDWTVEQLAPLIPEDDRRDALLAEMQPRGLEFFTERIPAPRWPPPPVREGGPRCAYLQFSPAYSAAAAEAERLGWSVGRIEAGHFHAVVEPDVVANVIVRLTEGSE
jgi:pimeloyl-ACP methyl ester carboxylesterase